MVAALKRRIEQAIEERTSWAGPVFVSSLFVVFVLAVMIPVSPHFQVLPNTDSSVFLYTADRVLEGAIPYRDVWDHKGPLIYYIDALALGLFDGSRWGVWLFEMLFVLGAAFTGFVLLRRLLGLWPALFGSTVWLLALGKVLDGGNLTEEYGLLFQFAALYLFFTIINNPRFYSFVLMGIVFGASFLLRPNMLGIPVAIGLYLVWQAFVSREVWVKKGLALIFLGGAITIGGVAGYFFLNDALGSLWDAVFVFNRAYSRVDASQRFFAAQSGFLQLGNVGVFGLAGWATIVWTLYKKLGLSSPWTSFARMLLFALPLEVFLTTLSGEAFPHYFMSWLPVLACLAAFFIYIPAYSWQSPGQYMQGEHFTRITAISLLIGVALFQFLPIFSVLPQAWQRIAEAGGIPPTDLSDHRYESVLKYLEDFPPDQPLLLWGNTLSINWLTDRDAPTRFVYQTPFFVDGYVSEELVQEFILDLEANPAIIIDTTPPIAYFPSLGVRLDRVSKTVRPLYRYIQENYIQVTTLNPAGWDVYLPVGHNP